ncbi:hypothetical protein SAMN05216369_0687 [Marinobacter antarcticus]|uniref:Uncharacterized protein n=1 Tax=Marinobacter antarcticus TaxID=564117 RepID=A0A1M6Q4S7_9GAMM|nr:hypothetical protein SAMN05216369_0687 [Marinobacter antarcticus]
MASPSQRSRNNELNLPKITAQQQRAPDLSGALCFTLVERLRTGLRCFALIHRITDKEVEGAQGRL